MVFDADDMYNQLSPSLVNYESYGRESWSIQKYDGPIYSSIYGNDDKKIKDMKQIMYWITHFDKNNKKLILPDERNKEYSCKTTEEIINHKYGYGYMEIEYFRKLNRRFANETDPKKILKTFEREQVDQNTINYLVSRAKILDAEMVNIEKLHESLDAQDISHIKLWTDQTIKEVIQYYSPIEYKEDKLDEMIKSSNELYNNINKRIDTIIDERKLNCHEDSYTGQEQDKNQHRLTSEKMYLYSMLRTYGYQEDMLNNVIDANIESHINIETIRFAGQYGNSNTSYYAINSDCHHPNDLNLSDDYIFAQKATVFYKDILAKNKNNRLATRMYLIRNKDKILTELDRPRIIDVINKQIDIMNKETELLNKRIQSLPEVLKFRLDKQMDLDFNNFTKEDINHFSKDVMDFMNRSPFNLRDFKEIHEKGLRTEDKIFNLVKTKVKETLQPNKVKTKEYDLAR